jgi:hypothetical protein
MNTRNPQYAMSTRESSVAPLSHLCCTFTAPLPFPLE